MLHIPLNSGIAKSLTKLAEGTEDRPKNPLNLLKSIVRKTNDGYEMVCTVSEVQKVLSALMSTLIAAGDLLDALEATHEELVRTEQNLATTQAELDRCKQDIELLSSMMATGTKVKPNKQN